MYSLPEPDPGPEPEIEPAVPRSPWSAVDIVVFAVFFLLTVLLLPYSFIRIWQIFNPALKVADLTAVDQVLLQGVLNVVLVGFIAFLIKVVPRHPFLETIHWFRNYEFPNSFLMALGATLAISVLIVSSFFPPSSQPPIERLLSSTSAMYIFAIFGIGVAPLFEEVIFRGFLFKVLSDIGGPGKAGPPTAGLFSFLHISPLWGSWAGIALIFFVGFSPSVISFPADFLLPSL